MGVGKQLVLAPDIDGSLRVDQVYSLALEQFHSLNQTLDTPFQP